MHQKSQVVVSRSYTQSKRLVVCSKNNLALSEEIETTNKRKLQNVSKRNDYTYIL